MSADVQPATSEIVVRPAAVADAEACGRICYEGFRAISERHGFPPIYASVEAATGRVRAFLEHPAIFGVVANQGDGVVGFNFLSERDPIRAVGPIVVDPAAQGRGVGRRLMALVSRRCSTDRVFILKAGLVLCPGDNITNSSELREDVVGGFGPGEGT